MATKNKTNPIARALRSPHLSQKVIKNKKAYNRKAHPRIKV